MKTRYTVYLKFDEMACQTKFYNFITVYNNFRGLLVNRPPLTNFVSVATLRTISKEKLKDIPQKPKKPLTPFFIYSQTRREELKKLHPNAKITEISKLLADEWKKVDETVKQGYEVEYKDAMTKYLKNCLDYNSKLTEDQKRILKEVAAEKAIDRKNKETKKILKELNKPKKPTGAFVYFAIEYYNRNKSKYANFMEFLKSTKPIWDNLPKEEKQRYNDMYLDDKKRYEIEMAEWEAKMISEGKLDLVRASTRITSSVPTRTIKPKASSDKSMKDQNIKSNNLSTVKESASKKSALQCKGTDSKPLNPMDSNKFGFGIHSPKLTSNLLQGKKTDDPIVVKDTSELDSSGSMLYGNSDESSRKSKDVLKADNNKNSNSSEKGKVRSFFERLKSFFRF